MELSKILDFLRWLKICPKYPTLQLGYPKRKPNLLFFFGFSPKTFRAYWIQFLNILIDLVFYFISSDVYKLYLNILMFV